MKLDWRVYAIVGGILTLALMVLFLEKILFFLIIVAVSLAVASLLRLVPVLKYLGIELATLSTMLVGVLYGPWIGGIYGLAFLISHLILGDYYIGGYLAWLIPEYILLGILSGIMGTAVIGPIGVVFVVGLNLLNILLTFILESDRAGKELPYAIGNSVINTVIIIQFLGAVVSFMG